MCGIAGVAGAGADDESRDGAVFEALRHRGPDASGIHAGGPPRARWRLWHTRLAIVDLSPAGNQPMSNEDGSLWLAFNGEIYNSPELRRFCEAKGHRFRSRSDGEVIVHLWEMEGWRCLRRLNGIYAVAVADARTGTVHLARDPLGVKPLVYHRGADGSLWFASELRALAATGADLGGPDVSALAQFLTFLWVPDPATPYRGARTLEPGAVVTWTPDVIQIHHHTDLVAEAVAAEAMAAEPMAPDGLKDRLPAAVERQLLSDVPVGLMASGGIDSSLVWWAGRPGLDRAFTIDWGGSPEAAGRNGLPDDEGLHEDAEAVRLLERHLDTPVTYAAGEDVPADWLPASGDLFADPAVGLTALIARRARAAGYRVLLSGQGGDEVFAGYRRHQAAQALGWVLNGPAARALSVVAGAASGVGPPRVRTEYLGRLAVSLRERRPIDRYLRLCSWSSAPQRAAALGCTEAEVAENVVWSRHHAVADRLPTRWSLLRQARVLDLAVYLPGLGLAYADRAAMHHSVEVRVPLVDLDVVRWSLGLPDDALISRGRSKVVARRLAADVLPPLIATRPKRGFAAPRSVVEGAAGAGDGFRQMSYFHLAVGVLRRHQSEALMC